jgi:hypothetical protein
MATNEQSAQELNRPTDATQLGADQAPATAPGDDAQDMPAALAGAARERNDAGAPPTQGSAAQQGSDFDQQRRQGAAGAGGSNAGAVGQGMGHAETSGDEDRGYDQSGYRGGLGASGGREDLSDRHFEADQNPFTGGYGGGGGDKSPDDAADKNVGLDTGSSAAQVQE